MRNVYGMHANAYEMHADVYEMRANIYEMHADIYTCIRAYADVCEHLNHIGRLQISCI